MPADAVPPEPERPVPWSRRGFLLGTAAFALTPQFVRQDPASAAVELPGFPEDVELYRSAYRNWVGEITASGLWACAPSDGEQAVAVVDWARRQGWRIRPRGLSHGWSPLTVAEGTGAGAPVLLVDTTRRLTALSLESTDPAPPWRAWSPGPAAVGTAAARRPARVGHGGVAGRADAAGDTGRRGVLP